MSEQLHIWLPDAEKTAHAGNSLAHTLYRRPLTIFLKGELGAGKTTFLQGFGIGLGIEQRLLSPTYALEQRYNDGDPLLHLDLYRLSPKDADALVESSEDFPGIRCIEWSERLTRRPEGPCIDIALAEDGAGRSLDIDFRDEPIPSPADIDGWRTLVALPTHVCDHCDAVAAFAVRLAAKLRERCIIARPAMLEAAGRLHDLFRFVDFRPNAHPPGVVTSDVEERIHATWKQRYEGLRHEAVAAQFLREKHFDALADIIAVHGLLIPSPPRESIEQKILFYADKRVNGSAVVSLDERFADFRIRYANGKESEQASLWYAEAQKIEKELFPDGMTMV